MEELTGKMIFLVEEDWANKGEGGHIVHLFSNWDKAYEAFEKLVDYEKKNLLAADSIAANDVEYENENLLAADSIAANDVEYENDEDDNYSYVIETSSGVNFRSWTWYEKGFYDATHSAYILHAVIVDEEIKLY